LRQFAGLRQLRGLIALTSLDDVLPARDSAISRGATMERHGQIDGRV